ncbi:FAD-dependent oxidoreductase [Streptomyces viridosporus]|uniref:FAD-dependent oxidoreductase n=1 Tax=Streptomyces viridosporus TaxID=67581 RepID=UPI00331CCB7F
MGRGGPSRSRTPHGKPDHPVRRRPGGRPRGGQAAHTAGGLLHPGHPSAARPTGPLRMGQRGRAYEARRRAELPHPRPPRPAVLERRRRRPAPSGRLRPLAYAEARHPFGPYGEGRHLDRARFDATLLQAARAAGARLHTGRVRGVRREQGRWRIVTGDGSVLSAVHLVDATGRAARLVRRLGATPIRSDHLVAARAVLADRAGETGALDDYARRIAAVHAEYLTAQAARYRREQRWDTPFWRRRR